MNSRRIPELLKLSSTALPTWLYNEVIKNPALELDEDALAQLNAYRKIEDNVEISAQPIETSSTESTYERLLNQLGQMDLELKTFQLAKYIIRSLDSNGYLILSLDNLAREISLLKNIKTDKEEMEKVLEIVQDLDPIGVGARNLKECLLLQLKKNHNPSDRLVKVAHIILTRCFENLVNKEYNYLKLRLKLTDDELKGAVSLIQTLNPKPCSGSGRAVFETTSENVIPDFTVSVNENGAAYEVNPINFFKPALSQHYIDMYRSFLRIRNKTRKVIETSKIINYNLDKGEYFQRALDIRLKLLDKLARVITRLQSEFFISGDKATIKPMTLRMLTKEMNVDLAYVSYLTQELHIETDYGVFDIKSLLSTTLSKENGQSVSSAAIKDIIRKAISDEDKMKPITDLKLKYQLEKTTGYAVSRRLIAKYRKELNIPRAGLRKCL